MTPRIAYLARGKLFFKNGDLAVRQVESRFGQDIINRTLQRQQRNEWKTQGASTPFSGSMLWGREQEDPRRLQVAISAVTWGPQEGELLYTLETDRVGGLFTYNWLNDEEKRLFHREAMHFRNLTVHLELKLIAGSLHFPNGTANLGLVRGQNLQQITEGDSVDESPSWIRGEGRRLVYQSAGVARNAQGYAMGVGSFAVQQLDLDNGNLSTLLEETKNDLMSPRMTEEGVLYFIRRPYETLGRKPASPLGIITDILLFPLRLLRAFFYFFNFLSLTFARKPLTTSSGPRVEGDDEKTLILRGRVIDAEKALREGAQAEAPSLVPPSWELVRRQASGEEQVLAQSVVAYDLDGEGGVVYTNGTAAYQLDCNGQSRLLFKAKLLEDLIVVR
jgi:hypothetical protein